MGIQSLEGIRCELAAALGRVDHLAGELLELLNCHYGRVTVPVCGQEVTRAMGADMDAAAPVALAGG